MQYSIEAGTISDALKVDALIPEFDKKKTRDDFEAKLLGKEYLILIAKYNNKPVAYNVGYEVSNNGFYCWLSGVSVEHRKKGLASQFLEQQKLWAIDQGYKSISVKSKNLFPNMLKLLIAKDYKISGYEHLGGLMDNKIKFIKELVPGT